MKKYSYLLTLIITLLILLPYNTNAKTKYQIDYKKVNDYVCEDIKDHILVANTYDKNKLMIDDVTNLQSYIIDITNPGVCAEYEDPIFTDDSYIWGMENEYELYSATFDFEQFSGWHYISDLEASYPFAHASGEYDSSADYYEITDSRDAVLVTNKNKTDFDAGKYYTIVPSITKTLLAEFTTTKFIAPKEKTGLDTDVEMIKNDFLYPIRFNDKAYFIFLFEASDKQYIAVFDETGTYQTFGKDKILLVEAIDSVSERYIGLVTEQGENHKIEILDKDYNLVLTKTIMEFGYMYFFGSDNTSDYLIYEELPSNQNINQTIVKITPKTTNEEFKIINNLKNMSNNNSDNTIAANTEYKTTLTANKGYKLPENVYILIGGSELSTESYNYDPKTGTLVLPAKYVTGNITIVGEAIKDNTFENPKTFDGVGNNILMVTISLISLIGIVIYLKKARTN